ncbi:MAG: serine/threonine protein kinase [Deltaproteobacteria bacterium]|nr:serine/threonine protein kinase [Deltaproteobacteria bacterium]
MTELFSQEVLRQMASRWLPAHRVPQRFRIHTDTTDFFRVEYDDVALLGGAAFLIRHNAKELRFGLDEEVKFWVKRAINLHDGGLKVIKLVFYEEFVREIGGMEFRCFRSPEKEARILDLACGHENFMQGYSVKDDKGNLVRVLDFIRGETLDLYIRNLMLDHQTYFHEVFPSVLDRFMTCIEAIHYIHELGEIHGDIRRDHILIDKDTGRYLWIDFDYNYHQRKSVFGYDLFGLGNILAFLTGMGDISPMDLKKEENPAFHRLREGDFNIVFGNRIVNLRRIYPYIPETLNRVLMHFSVGATQFYEHTDQLIEDLEEFRRKKA